MSPYILNGISPSPQVEIKVKTKRVYKVHGNDFIYNLLGEMKTPSQKL